MSHFPEPGEAREAAEALDLRLRAAAPPTGGMADFSVHLGSGEIGGEEIRVRGTYGDLFDIAETAGLARGPVRRFLSDVALGQDPEVSMLSLYLMATAHGVLMERARWQK